MAKQKPASLENVWSKLGKGAPTRPESAAYKMDGYDAEHLLGEAVAARYGEPTKENLPGKIKAMRQDMGVSPYHLNSARVNVPPWRPGLPHDDATIDPQLSGDYKANTNALRVGIQDLNGPLTERDKLATAMHELAHQQDTANSLYPMTNDYLKGGMGEHHKDLQRFEPEMALMMAAQDRIEHDLPPSPEMADVRGHYPNLRKVRPLSSNKLATPWDIRENLIPAEVWNANQ